MASGFLSGTTDLDDLFMLYTSGTKVSTTGFRVGSVDFADRYQPYTTGAKRAACGFRVGSTDLSDLFQASNVPLFTLNNGAVFSQDRFDANSPYLLFDTNGDVFVYSSVQEGDNWGNPLTTGIGSSYDIYLSGSGSGTMTGAALDTWHNLGTVRQFTMTAAPNLSIRSFSGTWQIRAAGGGSALASGTWSLSSDRTG